MADDAGGRSGDETPPPTAPNGADAADGTVEGAPDAMATDGSGPEGVDGTDPASSDGTGAGEVEATGPVRTDGRREVVVPERLYRVVTVFSTLLAVLTFVLGFAVLDAATTILRNPPGSVVVRVLTWAGVPASSLEPNYGTLALLVALLGLALVAGSAVFYAYGTRFRPRGMGKPKDGSREESDDG